MEKKYQISQPKRILFLISLPETPEFESDREEVALRMECMEELRGLNVDVRNHIWHEDLWIINAFDIVIVVAHHDTQDDALILADGKMPLQDFVGSLPTDFNGVIDFSSCYSIATKDAIKRRCPHCRVNATLTTVPLMRRIIMYPEVVQLLCDEPSLDYGEAFEIIGKEFDSLIDGMEDEKTTEEGSKATELGTTASVGAPFEVEREVPFMIVATIHSDSDKGMEMAVNVMKQTFGADLTRDEFDIPDNDFSLKNKDDAYAELIFEDPKMGYYVDVKRDEKDGKIRERLQWRGRIAVAKFGLTIKKNCPLSYKSVMATIRFSRRDKSIIEGESKIQLNIISNEAVIVSMGAIKDKQQEISMTDNEMESLVRMYFGDTTEAIIRRLPDNEDSINKSVCDFLDSEELQRVINDVEGRIRRLTRAGGNPKELDEEMDVVKKQGIHIVSLHKKLKERIDNFKRMLADFGSGRDEDLISSERYEIGKMVLEITILMHRYKYNFLFMKDFVGLKTYLRETKDCKRLDDDQMDELTRLLDKLIGNLADGPDKQMFNAVGFNILYQDKAARRSKMLMTGLAFGKYIYEKDKNGRPTLNIEKFGDWRFVRNGVVQILTGGNRKNKINEVNRDVKKLQDPQNMETITVYAQNGSVIASIISKTTIRIE